METKDKVKICSVVAQAILADGQLTDSEHQYLTDLMTKYELDEEQRKEVMARNLGDDPAALAEGIEDFAAKNELITELAMAVAADGQLAKTEQQLLEAVGEKVGISQTEIDMLVKTALS